jgi:hypothetical protein
MWFRSPPELPDFDWDNEPEMTAEDVRFYQAWQNAELVRDVERSLRGEEIKQQSSVSLMAVNLMCNYLSFKEQFKSTTSQETRKRLKVYMRYTRKMILLADQLLAIQYKENVSGT